MPKNRAQLNANKLNSPSNTNNSINLQQTPPHLYDKKTQSYLANQQQQQSNSPLSQSSLPTKYNELQVTTTSIPDDEENDYDDLVVVGQKTNKTKFIKQQQEAKKTTTTTTTTTTTQKTSMDLEDFDMLKVIGRGSYAKVFLVEYKKNEKLYAMKV